MSRSTASYFETKAINTLSNINNRRRYGKVNLYDYRGYAPEKEKSKEKTGSEVNSTSSTTRDQENSNEHRNQNNSDASWDHIQKLCKNAVTHSIILACLIAYTACAGSGLCDGLVDQCVAHHKRGVRVVYLFQFSLVMLFSLLFYLFEISQQIWEIIIERVNFIIRASQKPNSN